ncbi:T9SS type A sorting domain-containing protein [Flavobacterium jejuense]|uniref:T9SS type A sorting domain-containing protein n=1 Tax=Flavobacterium jejuense TaxID=1544455 RepID=A0ABX0ISR2_9FLAO|nr:T9SS type A sorting domain-containing protein [Flavobacterium jejuense]NHN26568.1 T9SS type A sorting domain-containing protein [Flavobacterium jejuense]
MKKTLLFIVLILANLNFAQNVNIPDSNFKNALLAHGVTITGSGISKIDTNNDGEIQITEATAYTGLVNVGSKNISSLTGIEAFGNIAKLYCNSNSLTSINVTQNTALIYLYCNNNQLTSLDVSQNVALTELRCDFNQLLSLDITQNTALIQLICSSNHLTSLDVTQNTTLEFLICDYNSLTSLDVTQNTVLEYIYCHNNQLTSLDLSQNIALLELDCYFNQLTNLDVTQNTSLIYLYCNNNQLTSLDVAQNTVLKELICSYNQLTSLDVAQNTALEYLANSSNQLTYLNIANGNNVSLTYFYTQNNSNLTCIQIDNGFTPPSNWNKDTTASYSTNCALSTNDFEFSKQVTIYPNPANAHFQVDLENSLELKTITVYNNLGQQVLTTNLAKVNTSSLSKGMYYVEIVTNAGKANKKIIIE